MRPNHGSYLPPRRVRREEIAGLYTAAYVMRRVSS